MAFKFGTRNIAELGQMINDKLREDGIKQKAELIINVNKGEFRKIGEDLFYRNNEKKEEFIPSEDEIIVNFDNVKIIIKEN